MPTSGNVAIEIWNLPPEIRTRVFSAVMMIVAREMYGAVRVTKTGRVTCRTTSYCYERDVACIIYIWEDNIQYANGGKERKRKDISPV